MVGKIQFANNESMMSNLFINFAIYNNLVLSTFIKFRITKQDFLTFYCNLHFKLYIPWDHLQPLRSPILVS